MMKLETPYTPVTPRPAATLILTRDGTQGMEIFLLQRNLQARFMAGVFVFPGGVVDPGDADPALTSQCVGLEDDLASRLLGLERNGIAFWNAAIRECFEEAGLLLARDASGELIRLDTPSTQAIGRLRSQLAGGKLGLAELCREHGLRLALDQLAFFGHWITPQDQPRRFDTRFFITQAPSGQEALPDYGETIDHLWIRPAEALERFQRQEFKLATATIKSLELLSKFSRAADVMQHVRGLRNIPTILPRAAQDRNGRRMLLPDMPAYAEIRRLDPLGRGSASCEIVPGASVQLSPLVRRITAPNPSFMTGPGTNSYLVGDDEALALIDPGPDLESHVEALLREAQGRIRWILATHTHMDHSPAARAIQAATGAQLLGMPAPPTERQDQSFVPDRVLAHGERLRIGACTLRVLHTPGHASNHLCYLLEEEKLLFTGDHIMQGSTVVINPPDGDMGAYLASLRDIAEQEDLDWLAPGHGFLMDQPRLRIERLLEHRMAREEKVLQAMRTLGPAPLEDLLGAVYDDVPVNRMAVARRSLLAHLQKLQAERRAAEIDERWRLLD